jgi:hypothetical protein
MEPVLVLLGGLGGIIVGGMVLVVVLGAFVLMHNSKRLSETT